MSKFVNVYKYTLNQPVTDIFLKWFFNYKNDIKPKKSFFYLFSIYNCLLCFRIWFYAYLVVNNQLQTFYLKNYDFFILLINKRNIKVDYIIFLSISGIPISSIALYYLTFVHKNTKIWFFAYNIIIDNRQQLNITSLFDLFCFQISLKQFFTQPLHSLLLVAKNTVNIITGIPYFINGQFIKPLKFFSLLTVEERIKVILVVAFYEFAIKASFILGTVVTPLVFFYFYTHINWLSFVLQCVDFLIIAFSGLIFLKCCIFLICITNVFQIGSVWNYRQQNFHLTIFLKSLIKSNFHIFFTTKFSRSMQKFLLNHAQMTTLNLTVNELTSTAFFTYFLTNLFSNIYIIVFLYFKKMPTLDLVISITFWCLQFFGPWLFAVNILRVNTYISLSKRNILLIINRMKVFTAYSLSFKWKLVIYYELLHRNVKPLEMTAGPLGPLNKYSLFKVSIKNNIFKQINCFLFLVCYFLWCLCYVFLWNYHCKLILNFNLASTQL